MQGHEYFEQLCALAVGGHLEAEEGSELVEHVKDCSRCRQLVGDFDSVLLGTLSVAETGFRETLAQLRIRDTGYKERFLARARQNGLELPAGGSNRGENRLRWLAMNSSFALGTVALVFIFSGIGFIVGHYGQPLKGNKSVEVNQQKSPDQDAKFVRASEENARLESEVANLQQQVSDRAGANAIITQRNLQSSERIRQLEAQLAQSQSELTKATTAVQQLQGQLQDRSKLLLAARGETDQVKRERDELEASLVDQQTRLNALNEQVKVQTAALEMERKLVAVGRDVRELMGARDLHIVDVHDFNSVGKQESAFGRVFFTRGKSLVFYAFDLNEKKVMNQRASFQVWGQKLGSKESTRSLGMLYVDDQAQRRWALKVSDPNLLKEIDTVFVTLEKDHGAKEPTGSPLMHAFLGSHPNHP